MISGKHLLAHASSWLRNYLIYAPASADEEAAFVAYCNEHTLRLTRLAAIISIAATVLWWPFDLLLYGGQPATLAAFLRLRLSILAVSCAGLAISSLRATARRPLPVMVSLVLLQLAGIAHGVARLGGPTSPWFHGLYLVPVATTTLFVPLGPRVWLTLASVATAAAAYFGPTPAYLAAPHLGTAAGLTAFVVLFSVTAGHVIYHLARRDFFLQRALTDRAGRLEEIDRLKSDFVANVSHEIRTPLTLLLASIRTLAHSRDDDERRDASEVGLRHAARLLLQINALLDLARFDSGRAEPERVVVDVAALTASVARSFQDATGSLAVAGADQPLLACVDRRQLQTLLYNLLANAIKFTDPARRRIRVGLRSRPDRLTLTVEDNGVGIRPELLPHVFDRFSRGDPVAAAWAGSGIGLSLVAEIVARHGGSVRADSEVGLGSRFTVELPRGDLSRAPEPVAEPDDHELISLAFEAPSQRPLPTAPGRPGPAPDRTSPLVLVVEDHHDLRRHLARLLAARWTVAEAADGREALEAARSLRPDLILTDLFLPHLNGRDLVAALRDDPALAATPVVVLTAITRPASRVDALAAGADDYVTKPFVPAELLARIGNQLRLRSQARELARANELLEHRVAEQARDIRALASHAEAAHEEERRRLARELHDELSQSLTAVRIEVSLLERRAGDDAARTGLQRVQQGFTVMQETIAHLLASLRPLVLDDLGLAAALEWQARELHQRAGIPCELRLLVPEPELPAGRAAVALFRIAQEALTNVARHSGATLAVVSLAREGSSLCLTVTDDGRGLPEPQHRRPGAMGLLGMRERAIALGGACDIERLADGGTRVRATLPA